MPNRTSSRLAIGLSLLALWDAPANAQSARSYWARVDSLRPIVAAARRRVLVEELARGVVADTFETIQVGAVIVRVSRTASPLARDAASRAWNELQRRLGALATLASRYPLYLAVSREAREANGVGATANASRIPTVVFGLADRSVMVRENFSPKDGPDVWTRRMVDLLTQRIWRGNGEPLGSWLAADEWSGSLDSRSMWTAVYRELVTTPSQAVARCYQGDLSWCRISLGLTAVSDGPLSWYAPAERRGVVAGIPFERLESPSLRAAYSACLSRGRIPDCDAVLVAHASEVPPPLSRTARVTVVSAAFQMGGTGAYERLVAVRDTAVPRRLAALASTSPDSLIATWWQRVLNARPLSAALAPRTALSTALWCMCFLGLSLLSSRWR